MKAIYYNAKKEVIAVYENVSYIGYETDVGFQQDTITVKAHIDGDPIAKPVAFIRLAKGERVEFSHEYKKPECSTSEQKTS